MQERADGVKLAHLMILFAVFVAVGVLAGMVSLNKLHDTVTIEAGEPIPDVSRFIRDENITGDFVTDPNTVDMNVPGVYNIEVRVGGRTYKSTLEITDTIAPLARPVDRTVPSGRVLKAGDFVTDIVDSTEVSVSFANEPDFKRIGIQEIAVLLEDQGGNITEQNALLTVLEDNEPPRIIGAHDQTVYIGDRVSYRRDVSVTDNMDEHVKLDIISSAVNLKKEGSYPVIYTAADVSGNTTVKTVTFTVAQKTEDYVDKEELNPLLDEVLKDIISEDMTQLEKARAIYNWTKHQIGYVNYPDMGDWVSAAYQGIKNRRGDCFIYYSTAQALLTRADIENQRIAKTGGGHYWNLVNLGDGWYHFDTTPRRGGGDFFMLTDVELEKYSEKHNNSHVWDRTKYPATPTE
ncbi:MAG: transglutaminase-like domain-containing protein [Firmicutes bacterium]|nr:transglutaminase-like domain-containing protein [Bacillota bacterium]MDD3298558.1 transglutaminase-like domain-containing protein [Bacillota bacterium]